jgi:hypothetical protein
MVKKPFGQCRQLYLIIASGIPLPPKESLPIVRSEAAEARNRLLGFHS